MRFVIATANLMPALMLAACVGSPVGSEPLSRDIAEASETYKVALGIGEIASRLHEHEKFCGPFEDIVNTGPDTGEWRKHTANVFGQTREVLVIEMR